MVVTTGAKRRAKLQSNLQAQLMPCCPINSVKARKRNLLDCSSLQIIYLGSLHQYSFYVCAEYLKEMLRNAENTLPVNATGHPALTINAGFSRSEPHLPIGMMLIGKRFDDATVLRLGHAYERLRNASSDYLDMEMRLRSAMKSHKR